MKIVGHRGAPEHAPESTMASFEHAIGCGADGIEFDVHRSADGAFVVIHDFAVDRTTNGSGLVRHRGIEYLSSLDAGSWFSDEFIGQRVPTLAQVLALPDVEFELEVKTFTMDDLRDLVDQVAGTRVLDRVEFTSSNSPMLMALHEHCNAAQVGVFSPRRQEWMVDEIFEAFIISRAEFAGAEVVHVHADDLTKSLTQRLHELGLEVHANDASSTEVVTRVAGLGADRTTVNDPLMARAAADAATLD